MVPWDMLPKDVQKAILAMILVYGASRVCAAVGPMVCDPVPPPSSTPLGRTPMIPDPPPPPKTATLVRTPMICDVPPPTRGATPTPLKTPMICDPAPGPTRTPRATSTTVATYRYQVRSLQTASDASVPGATIKGVVRDEQGQPLKGIAVTAQGKTLYQALTDGQGKYVFNLREPGDYKITVAGAIESALPLRLEQHDVVTLEWARISPQSVLPLPLAEIRSVEIVCEEGPGESFAEDAAFVFGDSFTFSADTLWADARYRWSVSGGTLTDEGERVTWLPPDEPGRYLLQVVADWGADGLAVDAVTLVVQPDGTVWIG